MKAVIETATGKALYLFGDGETVTVTASGMTSPVTALDIRSATHSVVTTTAPSFFTGGGVMRWDDAWEILDQAAYDAAYAAAQTSTPSYPTLTRKQLRNGLLSIGVTSADVEAQIAAISDPLEREAAMIDWQDTQAYERTNPLVNQIGVAMGLPEAQIDALWLWAAGS